MDARDLAGMMEELRAEVAAQPYPLLFATISGAHLYGFPSADSDVDIRGAHVLPAADLLAMGRVRETLEASAVRRGVLLETVTHDVKKFFTLLLKRNGYVLEQLFSPLVVHTSDDHEELKDIGRRCITRQHHLHYLGFARTAWKLFAKRPTIKQALYLYRVLMTGIHLMRTGEVEANLAVLNVAFGLPFIPDLIARKVNGSEEGRLDADLSFHALEYSRLCAELETAAQTSSLPQDAAGADALNDLLLRIRLETA